MVGKFAVGLFAKPFTLGEIIIFGSAMNGRGEFSFLIAEEAVSESVVDDVFGSGAVWGIIVATLLSPVMFRYLLKREARLMELRSENGAAYVQGGSRLDQEEGNGEV